jgi:TRAP-type uncharacterized transport system substrate-binding protein
MRDWLGGIGLRVAAAIICVIAVVWIALWYFIPAPPSSISVAAGSKGGSFEHLARRYRERLASHHVKLTIRLTEHFLDSAKLLRDPKSGLDAAFVLGGVTDSSELPGFVSLGRFAHSPIWIFHRAPETLDQLSQLKGKRVSIGPASGRTTTEILAAYGVNAENTTFVTLNSPPAAQALRDGGIDVMTISQEINNPTIQAAARSEYPPDERRAGRSAHATLSIAQQRWSCRKAWSTSKRIFRQPMSILLRSPASCLPVPTFILR